MLSARWAHRALVCFCVLLVIGVLIYSAYVGWLGPQLQAWCVWFFEPLVVRLQHAQHLDHFARVLGAVGTLLTAAVGVYKGIYYADRNLPERLKNLFDRTEERLNRDRAPLIQATTGNKPDARVKGALFYESSLNSALYQLGFPNLEAADKNLKSAVNEIERKIEIAIDHHRVLVSQKVTAHILRGSIASTRAEKKAREGMLADEDRDEAERELSAAISLRSNDLDGRELRGKQRELRGSISGAEEDFRALVTSALAENNLLRAARGQRFLGEMKEGQATVKTHWDAARASFSEGIAILQRKSLLLDAERLEKGLLHLGCGRVQIKLKRVRAARANLEAALLDLDKVQHLATSSAIEETRRLLTSLQPPTDPSDSPISPDKRSWLRRLLAG